MHSRGGVRCPLLAKERGWVMRVHEAERGALSRRDVEAGACFVRECKGAF